MIMIMATIGFLVVCWWVTGVVMFTFTNVLVFPGTPLSVKVLTVLHAGFVLPWLVVAHGRLPVISMIAPTNPTPEEQQKIEAFTQQHCPCPKCKARRGE